MMQTDSILTEHRLFEITGHARGGQGMVTAFEILAKIFSHSDGWEVQAFPSFGVERTGAPIQGFLRISREPIYNRSNIYNPNLIVVFDESLISQVPVFDGLRENGILLLNTAQRPDMFKGKAATVYTVPATKISIEHKLGSRSLPIVNAAMIGALVKILGGDIEISKAIIREEVPVKPDENAAAAEVAYSSLNIYEGEFTPKVVTAAPPATEVPLTPAWSQPMSLNKTGSWRLSIPIYVTREAPCSAYCPTGMDVRGFIDLAAEEKFNEGYDLMLSKNPFPSLCGRVCERFCENHCNRKEYDGALNISAIERFLGDRGMDTPVTAVEVKHPEKIAITGTGPAALTAALRLRESGYDVTVFESKKEVGGLMREKYSGHDLPTDVLHKEIKRIADAGVEIKTNQVIPEEELKKSYEVIVTTNDDLTEAFPVFRLIELSGTVSVAHAIGHGNDLSKRINAHLRSQKYEAPVMSDDIVKPEDLRFHYYVSAKPHANEYRTISESSGIVKINEGLPKDKVVDEANRCMHCGKCYLCGNCFNYCPDSLVYFNDKGRLRIDYEYCKGCGICYRECPSSAMTFDVIKKIKQ